MCHPVLTNTNLFSGEDVSGELDDGVVSLADRLLQVVQTSDLGREGRDSIDISIWGAN